MQRTHNSHIPLASTLGMYIYIVKCNNGRQEAPNKHPPTKDGEATESWGEHLHKSSIPQRTNGPLSL